jgi:hypothetical protein
VSFASLAAPRGYLLLKGALFALLTGNTAVYLSSGTLSEALDSVAWLALLVSFELETGFQEPFGGHRAAVALRVLRLMAAAALAVAAIGYVRDSEWLDAINVGLWIAVVALLEIEVRRADAVARNRPWFAAAAVALYSGLAVLVVIWLWAREWFDAYDATLWLIAFAIIEMNLLGRTARTRR